jgi:hypothetical protein
LCVPSQSGAFPDLLQPQNQTVFETSALYLTGVKLVPLWLPLQKGCFEDRPHAHQK